MKISQILWKPIFHPEKNILLDGTATFQNGFPMVIGGYNKLVFFVNVWPYFTHPKKHEVSEPLPHFFHYKKVGKQKFKNKQYASLLDHDLKIDITHIYVMPTNQFQAAFLTNQEEVLAETRSIHQLNQVKILEQIIMNIKQRNFCLMDTNYENEVSHFHTHYISQKLWTWLYERNKKQYADSQVQLVARMNDCWRDYKQFRKQHSKSIDAFIKWLIAVLRQTQKSILKLNQEFEQYVFKKYLKTSKVNVKQLHETLPPDVLTSITQLFVTNIFRLSYSENERAIFFAQQKLEQAKANKNRKQHVKTWKS
ncbi:hypothetical protein [Ureaplasma ceti]|uniref:Uncharacterized protein n=1 Tax=Ureaplasma ceti TaxID=3119530 RepID=A0ABP9UB42_9BACT